MTEPNEIETAEGEHNAKGVGSTDWLDGLTWIRIAISRGATLSVSKTEGLHTTFEATLLWPLSNVLDPFEAEGRSLKEILLSINEQLCEDAAQEMIDSGAV